MELDRIGDIWIDVLLVWKLDIEADAATASFVSALVSCLHDGWAATGNNGVTILSEHEAELFGDCIIDGPPPEITA